ncbi:hypothetical protein Scep_024120 [Stephania cephalantha]|uniref:Uncharacterized protein n=1 Tax=Stephania cephalantha TaxID=152367 RepID=A0AAP0EVY4_9MAGN
MWRPHIAHDVGSILDLVLWWRCGTRTAPMMLYVLGLGDVVALWCRCSAKIRSFSFLLHLFTLPACRLVWEIIASIVPSISTSCTFNNSTVSSVSGEPLLPVKSNCCGRRSLLSDDGGGRRSLRQTTEADGAHLQTTEAGRRCCETTERTAARTKEDGRTRAAADDGGGGGADKDDGGDARAAGQTTEATATRRTSEDERRRRADK